ncbi:type II toxin-antitoxin system VapC family toxin [Amycolatopsis nigrescens]|uniref:type II toxin-antitoxin system VapC family toxin n=1 Tax=Amycolatopsis nigrescens TaxID=381445 RepID=UPI0003703334|nr:type II toxin-antitoxin system VapC family toxin [Amycolatopsis nigrescens]
MSTFADTSALVKIYADEPGDEYVRSLRGLMISEISRVEVPAALWGKQRTGALTAEQVRLLVNEFEADYRGTPESPARFSVVQVSTLVLEVAARLTGVHGLRAYDAVQLATAQLVASTEPGCRSFAAFDKRLRDAAAAEGFQPVP